MKHFWKKSVNESPTSSKLARSVTLAGRAGKKSYKIETLEYVGGKVTSVLFETSGEMTVGKNVLQVSYDKGLVRLTSKAHIEPPVIDETAGEPADQVRDFVREYAEGIIFSQGKGENAQTSESAVRGKHARRAQVE